MDIRSLGGVSKKVYLFIREFRICAVHIINNNKLWVNFEVIVFQIGLDVSQNPKVVIVKKDGFILCNIFVRKSENGGNVVINSCIPLGNTWNRVQHMHNMQISWNFSNDEVYFVLWGILQEFNIVLVIESNRNR